jgi:acetyl-CoA carboxylase carboxyltransferase component
MKPTSDDRKTAVKPVDNEKKSNPIRSDLAHVIERHSFGLDERRPAAVKRLQEKNRRTARANVADLCDSDSFIEYGALAVAAQRQRRSLDELIERTPADGLIAGLGSVNGDKFDGDKTRCLVMAYDYSVLAGTQGFFNHKKKDRVLKLAHELGIPVVLFAVGGGGRPGDVDALNVMIAGLDLSTFGQFAALSGRVPVIGIVSGPCFAGNAALVGCCDVIIATGDSNIGMGGPVMIEGGGLGVFKPEEVGPMDIQASNGVVDILLENEQEAVAVAKKYLSYFQGTLSKWEAADQHSLRDVIPENRRRVYDVRKVINTLADIDSFLELRPLYGQGMITGLIRIEGKPFGLIANDCMHVAGAIEAEGADKAARLIRLCNAHGLPILSLCDTPGFMVGPEIEKRAQVRRVCRMFVACAHTNVPYFTVVLRRGYGLGAMAMAKGGFHEGVFTTAWPSAEFGAMGIEGAIKAGYKRELESITDPAEREKMFNQMVEMAYQMGKAINMASFLEIDSVIDPADTRSWIMKGLISVPDGRMKGASPSYFVDTW